MIYLAGLTVLSLVGSTVAILVALTARQDTVELRKELSRAQGYVGVLAEQLEATTETANATELAVARIEFLEAHRASNN